MFEILQHISENFCYYTSMGRFLMIFVWFSLVSFFWSTDLEKQLRTLHQSAESAFKKEDYATAKNHFAELIEKIGVHSSQKYSVDWPTYIDIILRYAEACEKTGTPEAGEKALSSLLAKQPPRELIPQIRSMLARLHSTLHSPATAYLEMRALLFSYPKDYWRKEEISFFHVLEYTLNSQYDEKISLAKRYLVTGYYNEAIALYDEILLAIEAGYYPKALAENSLIEKKIRYRLAECHYYQANYEQSLALCYSNSSVEDRIDREMLYLSALCYREKKEYQMSLALLERYVNEGRQEDLDHYDHALFEMGHFYYKAANLEKARAYFEALQKFEGKPRAVSALYLARMYIQAQEPERVGPLLTPIHHNLSNLMLLESYYLQAEAAFALSQWAKARDLFDRSLSNMGSVAIGQSKEFSDLPKLNSSGCMGISAQNCEWSERALFQLGWCYIRLGEVEKMPALFSAAEEIFTRLLKTKEKDSATFALGRLNLLRYTHFNDEEAHERVETLLSSYDTLEAYLIRSEAAEGYEMKESLLREATHERFRNLAAYTDAWYERGVNYFQEGLKKPEQGGRYFELAASAFAKSFHALDPKMRAKAAHILKFEAKAEGYRHADTSSLALLEQLLTQFEESVEEREETLYLRGLIASRVPHLFAVAEESLLAVAHGKGRYREEALYVLGTLYFAHAFYERAMEVFTLLAAGFPDSSFASEAWFWAAESAEKGGKTEHATALWINVYERYPESARAPEAYFRRYPYNAYLSGENRALGHLRLFPHNFPNSPLLVAVHYLIGINDRSKQSFEEAIKSFRLCLQEDKIPDSSSVYFRYQAYLKLAELYLDNDLDMALHLLHSLVEDFSEDNHPLTSLLMQEQPYPSLFEEGEYLLVQAYLKKGKPMRAQEYLAKMLKHYEEAGINKGYILSLVWKEQGKLAHECNDYQTALHCFEIAHELGEGYLNDEEKLVLFLHESYAYRGRREYDCAMRLLSKIINADVASPLRLKAMFHRAELYELQGRPELAIRQLEAMTKKGGDWAYLAQEKLREEYGL